MQQCQSEREKSKSRFSYPLLVEGKRKPSADEAEIIPVLTFGLIRCFVVSASAK